MRWWAPLALIVGSRNAQELCDRLGSCYCTDESMKEDSCNTCALTLNICAQGFVHDLATDRCILNTSQCLIQENAKLGNDESRGSIFPLVPLESCSLAPTTLTPTSRSPTLMPTTLRPSASPTAYICFRNSINFIGSLADFQTGVTNFQECQIRCQQNDLCFYFSYNTATTRCNLKDENATTDMQPDLNVISGAKYCPGTNSPVSLSIAPSAATSLPTYSPTSSPTTSLLPCTIESVNFVGNTVSFTTSISTVEQCRELCRVEPACFYFTYNGGTGRCNLKDQNAPSNMIQDASTISGLKACSTISPTTAAPPSITRAPSPATTKPTSSPLATSTPTVSFLSCTLESVNFVGNAVSFTTSISTVEQCRELCRVEPACFYFTYNGGTGRCNLKDQNAPSHMVQDASTISGLKVCPTTSPTTAAPLSITRAPSPATTKPTSSPIATSAPTVSLLPCIIENINFVGNAVSFTTSISTVEQCQELCRVEPACFYFTYNGGTGRCNLKDKNAPSNMVQDASTISGLKVCPTTSPTTAAPHLPSTVVPSTLTPSSAPVTSHPALALGCDIYDGGGFITAATACQLPFEYVGKNERIIFDYPPTLNEIKPFGWKAKVNDISLRWCPIAAEYHSIGNNQKDWGIASCSNSHLLPTSSPSDSPTTGIPTTSSPSRSPSSRAPTAFPSTKSPTTRKPTGSPVTKSPTRFPTTFPTRAPVTRVPTESPVTKSPTSSPTMRPTKSPITIRPTASPVTSAPTSTPTKYPTLKWDCMLDNFNIDGNLVDFVTSVDSFDECQAYCYLNSECFYIAYNFETKRCNLKGPNSLEYLYPDNQVVVGQKQCETLNPTTSQPTTNIPSKTPTVYQIPPTQLPTTSQPTASPVVFPCTVENLKFNGNAVGYKLNVETGDICQFFCQQNGDCLYYTYNKQTKRCNLKNSLAITDMTSDSTTISGRKICDRRLLLSNPFCVAPCGVGFELKENKCAPIIKPVCYPGFYFNEGTCSVKNCPVVEISTIQTQYSIADSWVNVNISVSSGTFKVFLDSKLMTDLHMPLAIEPGQVLNGLVILHENSCGNKTISRDFQIVIENLPPVVLMNSFYVLLNNESHVLENQELPLDRSLVNYLKFDSTSSFDPDFPTSFLNRTWFINGEQVKNHSDAILKLYNFEKGDSIQIELHVSDKYNAKTIKSVTLKIPSNDAPIIYLLHSKQNYNFGQFARVFLSAAGSNSDIVHYEWNVSNFRPSFNETIPWYLQAFKVPGFGMSSGLEFENRNGLSTHVVGLQSGTYTFSLSASDIYGLVSTAFIDIHVANEVAHPLPMEFDKIETVISGVSTTLTWTMLADSFRIVPNAYFSLETDDGMILSPRIPLSSTSTSVTLFQNTPRFQFVMRIYVDGFRLPYKATSQAVTLRNRYVVVKGSWNKCSGQCINGVLQGHEDRSVSCFDIVQNKSVHPKQCGKVVPSERNCWQSCIDKSTTLYTSQWSECSCKTSRSVREIECTGPRCDSLALDLSTERICSPLCSRTTWFQSTNNLIPCVCNPDMTDANQGTAICIDKGNGAHVSSTQCPTLVNDVSSSLCNQCEQYVWVVGEWSSCSKTDCASGFKDRQIHCYDRLQNMQVSDETLCLSVTRPVDRDSCGTDTCTLFSWWVGEWGVCANGSCGNRSREIRCLKHNDGFSNYPASYCGTENIPMAQEICGSECISSSAPIICTTRDKAGVCCEGYVNACGICNAAIALQDASGRCCSSGVLDGDGICCLSGIIDDCGVCDGSGLSCAYVGHVHAIIETDDTDYLSLQVTNLTGLPASRFKLVDGKVQVYPVSQNRRLLTSVANFVPEYRSAICGNGICESDDCESDCFFSQFTSCASTNEHPCSGHGICFGTSGTCSCWNGYQGEDCSSCHPLWVKVGSDCHPVLLMPESGDSWIVKWWPLVLSICLLVCSCCILGFVMLLRKKRRSQIIISKTNNATSKPQIPLELLDQNNTWVSGGTYCQNKTSRRMTSDGIHQEGWLRMHVTSLRRDQDSWDRFYFVLYKRSEQLSYYMGMTPAYNCNIFTGELGSFSLGQLSHLKSSGSRTFEIGIKLPNSKEVSTHKYQCDSSEEKEKWVNVLSYYVHSSSEQDRFAIMDSEFPPQIPPF